MPAAILFLKRQVIARVPLVTQSGSTQIVAGQVLVKKPGGTATAPAKAGNTGDGTFTLDPSTPVLANAARRYRQGAVRKRGCPK